MEPLTYEILAWLAAGNRFFRPQDATAGSEQEFRSVVHELERLRDKGMVSFLDGHVNRLSSGIYLGVGPVLLNPEGISALERDVRLGARPPWSGESLPWRV